MVEEPTPATSRITITFPDGVSTTRAELQLSNVDTVQVEIASNFLHRVAEAQFQQASMTHTNPKPSGIMVPRPVARI